MPSAPTFIQEAETAWNSTTSPKTTASFNVLAGDILVAFSIMEGWNTGSANTSRTTAISGGSLSWTQRQLVEVTDYTHVYIWTAVVDVDKAMTVSFTLSGASISEFGGNVLTFRGSDGYDTSTKTNVLSGAPTLNITTGQDHNAIIVANGDWNVVDGASRVWRANAGAFTEETYDFESGHYTVYGGFHGDAGTAGTYAVGLSAPSGQKYSIVAVSVKGSAAGTPNPKLMAAQGVG